MLLQCSYEYNHSNNYFRRLFGLYLYGTGSQWQSITVASHLGLSDSYRGITAKPQTRKVTKEIPGTKEKIIIEKTTPGGTLRVLSETMRNAYRKVAATGIFGTVYDNINWQSKVAEQTLGNKGICCPSLNW
jgi:hypothetical protein